MMKKVLIPTALLLFATLACKKDDDQDENTDPPVITIHEPTKDHFHPGDVLHIHIDVTDQKEMHEARFWLIAVPQNDTLLTKRKHAHDKVIEFEEDYTLGAFEDHEQKVDLVVKGENAAGKSSTKTFQLEVVEH